MLTHPGSLLLQGGSVQGLQAERSAHLGGELASGGGRAPGVRLAASAGPVRGGPPGGSPR